MNDDRTLRFNHTLLIRNSGVTLAAVALFVLFTVGVGQPSCPACSVVPAVLLQPASGAWRLTCSTAQHATAQPGTTHNMVAVALHTTMLQHIN